MYPKILDKFTTKKNHIVDVNGVVIQEGDDVLAEHINDLQDSVMAIQSTLGINPQGEFTTVRSRLDSFKQYNLLSLPAICIFFQDPLSIVESGSLEEAIDEYSKYDYVFFDHNALDDNLAEETTAYKIIHGSTKPIDFIGKVDVDTNLDIVKESALQWKSVGACGVYLEDFDYTILNRKEQNTILNYIRDLGLYAVVSGKADEIFDNVFVPEKNTDYTPTAIADQDVYLIDGFAIKEGYEDLGVLKSRMDQYNNYKKEFGVKLWATSYVDNQKDFYYVNAAAMLYSLDALFASPSYTNPIRYNSIPLVGEYQSKELNILTDGEKYWRTAPIGTIELMPNGIYEIHGGKIPIDFIDSSAIVLDESNITAVKASAIVGDIDPNRLKKHIIQAINESEGQDTIDLDKIDKFTAEKIADAVVELFATADEFYMNKLAVEVLHVLNNMTVDGHLSADRMTANVISAINGYFGNLLIDSAKIEDLDASKITSGYLNANLIEPGSIHSEHLALGLTGGVDKWSLTYFDQIGLPSDRPTLLGVYGKKYKARVEVKDTEVFTLASILDSVDPDHAVLLETYINLNNTLQNHEITMNCSGQFTFYIDEVRIANNYMDNKQPEYPVKVVLPTLEPGLHKLSIIYWHRDSTASNESYFQLTPHFSQKKESDPGYYKINQLQRLDAYATDATIVEGSKVRLRSLTAEHIELGSLTADSGVFGDLTADLLKSGAINTNLVTIESASGRMRLQGHKFQIFDHLNGKPYERIFLGVDDDNNAALTLRGSDGKTILLTQDGLTDEGFTDGYNKLEDNALDPIKINIDRVIERVNKDGSTTINANKVFLDDKTLDMGFSEITTKQEALESLTSQHSSEIKANKDAISLKLDSSTYTEKINSIDANIDTINTTLTDTTSAVEILQDKITLKVEQSDIDKATTTVLNEVSEELGQLDTRFTNQIADVNLGLDNIKLRVGKTEETISSHGTSISTNTSAINTLKDQVSLKVDSTTFNSFKDSTTSDITTLTENLNTASGEIAILQDQISLKVEQSDIDAVKTTILDQLSDEVSTINTTITNKVAEITTTTDAIINRVSTIESDLSSATHYIIVLSNENQPIITNSQGINENTIKVSTDIAVFKGINRVAATIGEPVVKNSNDEIIQIGLIEKTNPTATTHGIVTWSVLAGENIPADSGYLEIPLTIEDNNYVKKVYWSKVKEGKPGEEGQNARLVSVVPSHSYFISETISDKIDSYVYTPSNITIVPSFQNCTYNKWQYSLDGQTFRDVVSGTDGLTINSTTKTLTVSAQSSLYNNSNQIVFKALSNTGEFDIITIARIYDTTLLSQRVSTAEQKITDDAIISTVRQSSKYQSDLDAKASNTKVDDLISRVSTTESSIAQLSDSITLKVDSSTFEQSINTINDTIDSAKVDAINTAIQDATSKVQEAQNAANIYAKNQAEAAKDEAIQYTDGQVTAVNNRVSKNTSDISMLKDEITLKVTQTDIDESISKLNIVGRNLVLNSSVEHTFKNTILNIPLRTEVFSELAGKSITLSFYAKAQSAGQLMDWYLRDIANSSVIPGSQHKATEIPTEYTRFSYTIVAPDVSNIEQLSFAFRGTSAAGGSIFDTIYIKNVKIELGSKATDWTPAPEDLDIAIETIDTKINNKVSEINIGLDSITSRVSATESNIESINNGLSTLSNRVSTAEQKITPNAIVSTVRTSQQYLDDLKTKADESKVNDAIDRISSAESSITQLSQSISLKVDSEDFQQSILTINTEIGKAKLEAINTASQDATTKAQDALNSAKQYAEKAIYKSKTAPSSKADGDLWLDTSTTPNVLKRWNGTAWVKATPTTANEVGAETPSGAQAKANKALNDAKTYAETKASEAESAASAYAKLKAEEERLIAEAYADGRVSAEEQARINDVRERLEQAKAHAETKASEAESAAKSYAKLQAEAAQGAANEYTDDKITAVNTTINNKVSEINISLDSITSRVGSTETNITTINNNLSSLSSRVKTAEQKITPDAITSTVRNSAEYKNDLKNKVDSSDELNNLMSDIALRYREDIVIYGDSDKYYPLYIWGGNQYIIRTIKIWRGYAEQAPPDWNTPTHKGSLMLTWKGNFGAWGGAKYEEYIEMHSSQYTPLLADCFRSKYNMGYIFMLRGGGETGAVYHLASDQPLVNRYSASNTDYSPVVYYNGEEDVVFYANEGKNVEYAKEPVTEVNTKRLDSLTLAKTDAVQAVEKRIEEAELKITPNAIVSTVRSSSDYKNDLGNKVDLSTYETYINQTAKEISLRVKADNIISSINQTAETITIDASKINLRGAVSADDIQANAILAKHIRAGAITVNKVSSDFGATLDLSSNEAIRQRVTKTEMTNAISEIEVGGNNLISNSDDFSTGWDQHRGSTISIELVDMTDEWGFEKAYSVFISGGESVIKSHRRHGGMVLGQIYTYSVYIKNTGENSFQIHLNGLAPKGSSQSVTIQPNESRRVVLHGYRRANYDWFQVQLRPHTANGTVSAIIGREQLEKGNKATAWTPAPEDTQEALDNKPDIEDLDPIHENITNLNETTSDLRTDLDTKADVEDLDALKATMREHTAEISNLGTSLESYVKTEDFNELGQLVGGMQSTVEQLSNSYTIDFNRFTQDIQDANEEIETFRSYFKFEPNLLTIGEDNNPFSVRLSNSKMGFWDSGQEVSYISGQKMFITDTEVTSSLVVGAHKIEKYSDDITLVRWVGNE